MKRCNACDQYFEDKFVFCPADATALIWATAAASELRLTLLYSAALPSRLSKEIGYLSSQLKLAWPSIKDDPAGFSKELLVESLRSLRRAIATPNAIASFATAMLVVFSAVVAILIIGNTSTRTDSGDSSLTSEIAEIVEFLPLEKVASNDPGIGAGSNEGRVGFAGGRGEGSAPKPKRAQGGGGSGDHDPSPAQLGKLPQPSEIPAPIPKLPTAPNRTLPVAGIDVDPLLWKNLEMATYGDPRSIAVLPSNGPGDGGGMGTNTGTGIGEGKRSGFGPGQDGNMGDGQKQLGCCGSGGSHGHDAYDPDKVYPTLQVSERARVLAKPEPQYTEEARRNAVTGTVVLRVVFARTGEVTNIRAVQSLPFGLTERAIAAARQIRFRPAIKDGQPVNVFMQLEYNFNLY